MIATVVSSVFNFMWTMLVLYWELCGFGRLAANVECCCTVIRPVYESQTWLSVCYCGCCGCVTTSNCGCVFLGENPSKKKPAQPSEKTLRRRCKHIAFRIGKAILSGIIFLLYMAIFILGGVTLMLTFVWDFGRWRTRRVTMH